MHVHSLSLPLFRIMLVGALWLALQLVIPGGAHAGYFRWGGGFYAHATLSSTNKVTGWQLRCAEPLTAYPTNGATVYTGYGVLPLRTWRATLHKTYNTTNRFYVDWDAATRNQAAWQSTATVGTHCNGGTHLFHFSSVN